MNLKYCSILAIIILIGACKSASLKKEGESLKTQVMALHDETMANHGVIMTLASELKTKGQDSALTNLTFLDSIRTELDGLNEDMMDWMSDFDDPETIDPQSILYLKEQADILNKLKAMQVQNINLAKQLLGK